MERIPVPKMSEFLKDFMEDISAYRLAKEIGVPVSRIQDILHDRRKMTVDTSMRLGRFFGQDDLFFMRIQIEIDYREAKRKIEKELDKIKPLISNQVVLE